MSQKAAELSNGLPPPWRFVLAEWKRYPMRAFGSRAFGKAGGKLEYSVAFKHRLQIKLGSNAHIRRHLNVLS